MMVGRLLSFWDDLFSGAMLNFQGVPSQEKHHFPHLYSRELRRSFRIHPSMVRLFISCIKNTVDGSELRRENQLRLVAYPWFIPLFSKGILHPRWLYS